MGLTLLIMFGTYGLALWFGAFLIYQHYYNPRSQQDYTGGDVSTVFFSVSTDAILSGRCVCCASCVLCMLNVVMYVFLFVFLCCMLKCLVQMLMLV